MPSRSRQFRQEQDRRASWDRLRASPWSPFDLRRGFGSGGVRVQLVRLPSFTPPAFWELCQRHSEWLLYSSTVVDPDWSDLKVQGYEPVPFDGDKLKAYFERLTSLTLSVAPDFSKMGGLDGVITQLALFGDLSSQVRYQWWSEHPSGWSPLVEIVDEMFEAFGGSGGGRIAGAE